MAKRFNTSLYSEIGDLPCCGVYATAVASKVDFIDAWNKYASTRRSNWKGALYNDEILKGMFDLGVRYERVNDCKHYIGYPLKNLIMYSNVLDPNGVYIIFTTRHIQIVQGRNVIDQGGMFDIEKYRWNKKLVQTVYKITNFGNQTISIPRDVIENKGKVPSTTNTSEKKYSKWQITTGGAAYYIKSGNNREQILTWIKTQGYSHNSAMTIYYNARKVVKNG